jgi:hypothetical protein
MTTATATSDVKDHGAEHGNVEGNSKTFGAPYMPEYSLATRR